MTDLTRLVDLSALAVAFEEFSPVLFAPVGLEGVRAEPLHSLVELFLLAHVITDALDVEGAGRQSESDREDDGDPFEGFIHYAASRMRRTLPILMSRFSDQLTRKPVTPRLQGSRPFWRAMQAYPSASAMWA